MKPENSVKRNNFRVLSISSGKGGVGKTLITVNLAYAFRDEGHEILIIDGNFGNGNVEVMCKALPEVSMYDVLSGSHPIKEALMEISKGIKIIPAGTGIYEISEPDVSQKLSLLSALDTIDHVADIVIIDTPTGISSNVMFFNTSVTEIILVSTPEITSIVNTLSSINVLHKKFGEKEFKLVVNMVESEDEAISTYDIIYEQTQSFFDVNLHFCGYVPFAKEIRDSIRYLETPCTFPKGGAMENVFRSLARKILVSEPEETTRKGQQFFAKRVLKEEHDRTISQSEGV